MELDEEQNAEFNDVPVTVPGSVQLALKNAGIIPDWNYMGNARSCEWVENRHWMFSTIVPSKAIIGENFELVCEGLDYSGWIVWDGKIIGEFSGANRLHRFALPILKERGEHSLAIIFDLPPRWLGQFGYTSKYSVGKSRFYYTWDWMPRIVQTGITGLVKLRAIPESALKISELTIDADPEESTGSICLQGEISGERSGDGITVTLYDGSDIIQQQSYACGCLSEGITIDNFAVELWLPNGCGDRKLYFLEIVLERDGGVIDQVRRKVGFRRIRWRNCRNAPSGADPWLCEVNGEPLFIQGVNWTPIRPNYADVNDEDYQIRVRHYRDIGVNLIRIWGGASLEREILYDLCDEYGIMVWQEFPLCSSGIENLPPSEPELIAGLLADAEYYIDRLGPHASVIMWCGGNELQRGPDGADEGSGYPCTSEEPVLAGFEELVSRRDPLRRFVLASASGPREFADENDYGKGLHWDVHGPWKAEGALDNNWKSYWQNDDSLFRSEVGSPGASPLEIIEKYGNDWDCPLSWWNEHETFVKIYGREPESITEYVEWSQKRQAEMLYVIASECKRRFPACGGIIIWMGHDAFPCSANTSILDFHGNPKPAAEALKQVFKSFSR